MRRYRLLILGGVAYLLFMFMLFPASVAMSLFVPQGSPLQLQGVSGSLWQGSARQAVWKGKPLGEMHWDLQILSLVLGKLGTDFSLQTANGYVNGEMQISLFGKGLKLEEVSGQLPLSEVQAFYTIPLVSLAGTAAVDLHSLTLVGGNIVSASGKFNWHSAEVLSPQAFKLGNLQAEIGDAGDKGVVAKLRDSGGPLKLDAELTLSPTGSYQISGTAAAGTGAEPSLKQAMGWLGKADSGGKHRLNFSGHL